ncbi:Ig-like domain-containing protein [Paludibacter sp.]|uniref:Ig-like domain-containing protein n=1 Tax=Paludibacter sp. TaxID=1898105 RepID=UPI001353B612|nr:Ig-like domain-containing protein [Paludibacter sp.]MTK54369.1 Ig domain-containing protein [Paludibacter sp.]
MKKFYLLLAIINLLIVYSCSKDNEKITQLSFAQNPVQLRIGDTLTLKVTYAPANLPAPSCQWTNTDPSVATLDSHGKLTGISRGNTLIMITTNDGALIATCMVTVTFKGDGSVNNPYCIYTLADLKNLRDSINKNNAAYGNKAYKLMADLDFSKETDPWIPIGNDLSCSFKGVFDGNGKTITHMKISDQSHDRTYTQYAGFFGCIEGAIIKNSGIVWEEIVTNSVTSDTNAYIGGIAGYGSGTIDNCHTSGEFLFLKPDVSGYVGGIIGYGAMPASIANSHSDVEIRNGYNSGGIAGYLIGTISNCSAAGNLNSVRKYAGGIAGCSVGLIINSYSLGKLCLYSGYVSGGVSGYHSGQIVNCYATGEINGTYSGGIAGMGGTIYNCYASGDIYGYGGDDISNMPGFAGGIAAQALGITNCLAIGNVVKVFSNHNAARICSLFFSSGGSELNYANSSMRVAPVPDLSDTRRNGYNLTAQPVDLLNAYVTANPTFNGIPLSKWKVTLGVNNCYPVFE